MKQLSLVALTGAFAGGIWLGGLYDWPALMLYGTGMVTLAVAVWCIFRLPEKAWIFILAAFVVAGSIRFLHTEAVSPSDISRYTGQTVSAVAIVDAIPETVPLGEGLRRVKYILDVRQVMDSGGIVRPASGKLIATVRQDERFAIARYGDRVVFTGLVAAIHTYQNPGAYDYVAAQKRKGITARASISSENWAIVEHKPGAFWAEKLADWRTEVKQAMLAAMTPEQSAILTGMLFGGYEGIPQNVVKDFAATGLIHILSVSGTHIALVGGAILWLGRAARLRRSFIVLMAAAAIVLYSMLAGFTPPVVRSAVMGLVALLAVLLGRGKDAAAALALSALAMLIHTPGLLYDLSFQLSFAATAGLVFLYPATVQKLTSLTGMHGLAAAGLAVTFAAQLSVLPLLAWYFNSLSLSAFAANVLIVPIVEAIVIIGLAGAILVSFWGLAASALFALCELSISIVMTATAALAALPGSSIYLPPVSLAGSVLYYLLVAWVYGYTPRFMPPPVQIFRRWPRTAGAVMLIAVAAGVLYCITPRPVAVHFIDVGQGDAVLVTTPHGRSVLIDTGGAPGDSTFDIGERVVVPYLKHYGVLSLDYLILSHGHQDHAGG
ncbi:MAG: ComEC/Rec2 family competence protein, partial [Negativicutes bacterium]|nr:ComEC/Rec2 family competence protein [Negativicutes bacterium]